MHVSLSDGTVAEIPDGLPDDAIRNFTTRLEAANSNAKSTPSGASSQSQGAPSLWDKVIAWGTQTPTQALGLDQGGSGAASAPSSPELLPETQPLFPRDQYPGVNAALDWINANVVHSTPGNFVGNVGADVAAMPWDAPASISNAILHTAQNYGYAPNEPSAPMAAPRIKADMGVTPLTDPWAQRAETAAQIASLGGGGNLVQRLVRGVLGEAKGEAGSTIGGKIADATDPRLREGLETGGGIAAQTVPTSKIAAPVVKKLFAAPGSDATYQAAQDVQAATGSPTIPITAGQLGGRAVQAIESWLGKLPLVGAPVHAAQGEVEEQIRKARDIAAQNIAGPNATVDASPSAPGIALLNGVRDHVNSKIDAAKPQIDAIENQLGTQNIRGPGGGSATVDVRGLVNDLQGLKTATDAAGNVRSTVAPNIAAQIDAEIASINRVRQPEDPALHAQLQGQIKALQGFLNQSGVDPGVRAQVERQLQAANAARDANLKVPFEALRQMKTLQGAEAFGDGTPTLNGYMGGKVYRAYGGALQGFADNLDPALGAQYSRATGDYNDAMDARRNFRNITQGANENQLTSTMTGGLKGPESIKALAGTPAWNQAAANTIAMLGRTPAGAFDAGLFAKQWNSATDDAKTFYTRGSPAMRNALDAAATLGRGFRSTGRAEGPLTTSGLVLTGLAERALSHMFGEGTGAGAAAATVGVPLAMSAGLESGSTTRALAGRTTPWGLQLGQNLPALLAVAQSQGRNQGY